MLQAMVRIGGKGMTKLALNQTTYDHLAVKDELTFYFIDNTLKDGEIKNCENYLLSYEVAAIRAMLKEVRE